jgi:hypothetical protein
MAKELKMMSVKELYDLKEVVFSLSEKYSKQLLTNGMSDVEDYLSRLNERERSILDKRMKLVHLGEKIDNLIEEKIETYYD